MACIDTKSKDFKKLTQDFNVAGETMEIAIKEYQDKNNLEEYNPSDKNFLQYLKDYFKLGDTNTYSQKNQYNKALEVWEGVSEKLSIPLVSLEDAINLKDSLIPIFGEDNILMYKNLQGDYKINVAKPILSTSNPEITEVKPVLQQPSLENTKQFVDQMISDFNSRITFDRETHTYKVNGKPADFSVTQFINGNKTVDIGAWGLPSSLIGTTADTIVRDFFGKGVKSSYPNMSKEDLINLKEDLNILKQSFDRKFGEGNYNVVTTEFPIAAPITVINKEGKPERKVIAGTMDMLIYDKDGNLYIYDMKTSRSGIAGDKLNGYTDQLNYYKSILEANYPQLSGKIKELNLIHMKVDYPRPVDRDNNILAVYEKGEKNLGENPDQLYIDGYAIEDSELYSAPRIDMTSPLISLESRNYSKYLESLSPEDVASIKEEMGEPIEDTMDFQQKEEDRQKSALFNPILLPAQERTFLAKSVMVLTSVMVSHLQNHSESNNKFFPDGEFADIDFTTKSRKEILDIVGINRFFNIVRKNYFDPKYAKHITDFSTLKKLKLINDNWGALISAGKKEFMELEQQDLEIGNLEDDPSFETAVQEEGNIAEHWMIGQRQISAKTGLSNDIRRAFKRLPVLDNNGNQVMDAYGYNIPLYIDSGMAVNSILEWVNKYDNIEDMEDKLREMQAIYPWVTSILDKIQEEPFRSQFFTNFRKDFTTYSIISVDYDSNGNRRYTTQTINTKGVTQTALEEIASGFREGALTSLIKPDKKDIDGKGSVVIENVMALKTKRDEIYNTLAEASKVRGDGKHFQNTLESYIPAITELLNDLYIHADLTAVRGALNKDLSKRQLNQTVALKILNEVGNIIDTFISQEDNTAYNPFLKGTEGNVYSNYKNILNILSDFIQDSIESSTFENGKMYYSFTTPSYLQGLINKLNNSSQNTEKFEEFIENEYGSYRWFQNADGSWNNTWLDLLTKDKNARSNLQHKVQLSFESRTGKKTSYGDMSEVGYTMSLLHEYFYDKHKKWAWYRVPIMSNKESSEFIKFKRYSTNYKTDITNGMKDVLNQEIMRIKTVLEISKSLLNGERAPRIKNYDAHKQITANPQLAEKIKNGSPLAFEDLVKDGKLVLSGTGAEFKFLNAFNQNIINKDVLGQLILDKINGELSPTDEAALDSLFRTQFQNYMNERFKNERTNWETLGLYSTEEITTGQGKNQSTRTRYKYLDFLGNNKETINAALEEYMWNDMFATTNIIQLTVTDLAYYKNLEDFQKRYAQVHSPGMKMNISARDENNVLYSDGIERTIYLKDLEATSSITNDVKEVLYKRVSSGNMTRYQADTILAKYGYSNTEDGKFVKTEFNGKEVFIKSEKFSVSDAQGYSSPTSYRKKMGMMGKWDSTMEEAYNKIKSGNWKGEDLDVVWQPLKPFVYSQIRKNTGANTMKEIKVSVQNKNSEYLLLMADALLRGDQSKNKLLAIYDFMEESAYTNGKYNARGIDTIQFDTAVKAGLMGVIDINNIDNVEDIKQALKNAVYSDDTMSGYDNEFVHEIPYEDYSIQQEVPAHLMDNQQLFGTQLRILSISDITPGTTFTIYNYNQKEQISDKELVDTYQNLVAQNVNESFDKLIKEFKLEGTRQERNQAISNLLVDAVKNDIKYDADLEYACSLNSRGEFNVPLSDPIQSLRIQQLVNSIIKSRINKQKISGGPVVQASVFGFSDDLKIMWKTDNQGRKTVDYFESYIPVPSSELQESLTKEDGTLMSVDEALKNKIINPEQLKAIGYRIPTEDKYSMIPIKIKGFLSRNSGEAIILPKEITLLSGSDFDIDKMYVIVKDFNADYSKLDFKKIIPDFIKDEEFHQLIGTSDSKQVKDKLQSILQKIVREEEFKPDTPEAYINSKIEQNRPYYSKVSFNEVTNLKRRSGRNNKIFDLQWAVLTNPDTTYKMFNPGSFDAQKKTARIITILKNPDNKLTYNQLSGMSLSELDNLVDTSSGKDILFSSTQVYLHKQNMTAAKMIGIFANNNTSHAFLSLQDIGFAIDPEEGFNFNGVKVSNVSNTKLDNIVALDGTTLISKNIAGFLAASVDAVKDPVLNFLNLNTITSNAAMVLARLGFDVDSIGLLLTQPTIEKVIREYGKRNNEEYVSLNQVIDEELDRIKTTYKIEVTPRDLRTNQFLKEDMANQINLLAQKKVDNNIISYQAQALALFKKLNEMGQNLNTLTFLTKFNSVTNAVGPTIADTLVMQEKYKKFQDLMESNSAPFTQSAVDIIENSPILKAFYESTVSDKGASRKIFEPYFPHYSPTFETILSRLRQTTKLNLDSKTINKLVNDFVTYKLTMSATGTPVFDASYEKRSEFVNNFVEKFKKNSTDITNNDLIKIITIKSKSNKVPVATLEAKTGGYSVDAQERIKDAWTTLVMNPSTNELGTDLFFYNMIRSGFGFSPKTFLHLASASVKQGVPGYIDTIRDVEFNDDMVIADEFLMMFRRNNSGNRRIVPELKEDKNLKLNIKNYRGKKIYNFEYGKNKGVIDSIYMNEFETFIPLITYNDKVLYYESDNDGVVTYIETTPLGNTNNFLEYNGNERALEMKSAILEPILNEESFDETLESVKPQSNEDYFSDNMELTEGDAFKIALEKVFTKNERAELEMYNSEESLKRKFIGLLEEHLSEEKLPRLKKQLQKIIDKLC